MVVVEGEGGGGGVGVVRISDCLSSYSNLMIIICRISIFMTSVSFEQYKCCNVDFRPSH